VKEKHGPLYKVAIVFLVGGLGSCAGGVASGNIALGGVGAGLLLLSGLVNMLDKKLLGQ